MQPSVLLSPTVKDSPNSNNKRPLQDVVHTLSTDLHLNCSQSNEGSSNKKPKLINSSTTIVDTTMTSLVLPPPKPKRRGPPSLKLGPALSFEPSSSSSTPTPSPLVLPAIKSSTMVPYNPDETPSQTSVEILVNEPSASDPVLSTGNIDPSPSPAAQQESSVIMTAPSVTVDPPAISPPTLASRRKGKIPLPLTLSRIGEESPVYENMDRPVTAVPVIKPELPPAPLSANPLNYGRPKKNLNKKMLSLTVNPNLVETQSCPPSPGIFALLPDDDVLEEEGGKDEFKAKMMLKVKAEEMRDRLSGKNAGMGRRRSIPGGISLATHVASVGNTTANAPEPQDEEEDEEFPYQHGPKEILKGLYLGSEGNAKDGQMLKREGIKWILNVAVEVAVPWNDGDILDGISAWDKLEEESTKKLATSVSVPQIKLETPSASLRPTFNLQVDNDESQPMSAVETTFPSISFSADGPPLSSVQPSFSGLPFRRDDNDAAPMSSVEPTFSGLPFGRDDDRPPMSSIESSFGSLPFSRNDDRPPMSSIEPSFGGLPFLRDESVPMSSVEPSFSSLPFKREPDNQMSANANLGLETEPAPMSSVEPSFGNLPFRRDSPPKTTFSGLPPDQHDEPAPMSSIQPNFPAVPFKRRAEENSIGSPTEEVTTPGQGSPTRSRSMLMRTASSTPNLKASFDKEDDVLPSPSRIVRKPTLPLPVVDNGPKVLDLRFEEDGTRPIVNYRKLFWGHDQKDVVDQFEKAYEFIDAARNRGEKVLVHCQCGISRSGCAIILYVMKKASEGRIQKKGPEWEGGELQEVTTEWSSAYDFSRKKSRHVGPNMNLIWHCLDYGKTLKRLESGKDEDVNTDDEEEDRQMMEKHQKADETSSASSDSSKTSFSTRLYAPSTQPPDSESMFSQVSTPVSLKPPAPKATKRAPPPLNLKKELTVDVVAVGDVEERHSVDKQSISESMASITSSKAETKKQLSPLPAHIAPPVPTPFTAHPAQTSFRFTAATPRTANPFKSTFSSKGSIGQSTTSSFSKIFSSSSSIKSASSKGSRASKLSRFRPPKFPLHFPLPPSVTTQVDTPTASAFKPSPALNALNNTAQASGTFNRKRGQTLVVSTTNVAISTASPATAGPTTPAPPLTPFGKGKSFFSALLRKGSRNPPPLPPLPPFSGDKNASNASFHSSQTTESYER